MKYTEAPWEIDGFNSFSVIHKCDDGRWEQIANCRPPYTTEKLEESKVNAKLISAAPDLLEALEGILDIGKRDMSNPKYDTYFRTAKEAIKKARNL
jgi:hypothetical protein